MRRAALAFALLALLFSVPLLADDVRLQAGSMVPAAEGVVSLGHDSNGNVVYELNTAHLAQPTSLTPAKNYYVIWLKPRDGEMQNAGTLTVNPDKLEGKFKSATPFKNFDLIVTAEDNPRPEAPSGPEIFRGTIAVK